MYLLKLHDKCICSLYMQSTVRIVAAVSVTHVPFIQSIYTIYSYIYTLSKPHLLKPAVAKYKTNPPLLQAKMLTKQPNQEYNLLT